MADTRSSLASRGSDGADALDVLTRQHREVESLWAEVEGAGFAMSSSRTDTARQIVRLLSQHDAIETQVLYPELRDVGGDEGQRLSDDSLSDHRVIREMLKEIDRADDLDDRAYSALARCIAAVNHHIEEVEDVVFPLLRKNCSPERLQELGTRMASMMGTRSPARLQATVNGYGRPVSDGGSTEREDQRRAAKGRDRDAPGAFVDDEDADEVPEPNEPG